MLIFQIKNIDLNYAVSNFCKNRLPLLLGVAFASISTSQSFAADWAILDGEIEHAVKINPTNINPSEKNLTKKEQLNQQTEAQDMLIKKDLVELDLDSIVQMGHLSKAWIRISYTKPIPIILEASKQEKSYRSMMYRIVFDCINARYVYANTLAYKNIQARGEMLGRNKLSEREAVMQMKDIAPDSIAARVFKYSCQAPNKAFR